MAYCKKCKQEVEPGTLCPLCGQKLPANGLRLSFAYAYRPARDFLSWNNILRVSLPALALLLLAVVIVEWARKGFVGVQVLIAQGFWQLVLFMAVLVFLASWIALLYRGLEEVRYVLDHKGVHVQVWQVKPSLLKRILHRIPPDAPNNFDGQPVWMLEEKLIPWAALKRVETWPDKDKILLYSPRYWLVMAIHCLPDTYDDSLRYIYDRVKKQKCMMAPPPEPGAVPSSQV